MFADEITPPRPVVPKGIGQHLQVVGDAFAAEDTAQFEVGLFAGVVLADGQHDVGATYRIQSSAIIQIAQIIDRAVEVDILVVEAIHKALDAVCSAEGDEFAEGPRILEDQVGGVVGTKARPTRHDEVGFSTVADERYDFVDDVALVLFVALHAREGVDAFVVEAFGIHGVNADDLVLTAFQLRLESFNHLEVFPLKEAAQAAGKNEKRGTGVTETQHFHASVQARAVPLYILTFHNVRGCKVREYTECEAFAVQVAQVKVAAASENDVGVPRSRPQGR